MALTALESSYATFKYNRDDRNSVERPKEARSGECAVLVRSCQQSTSEARHFLPLSPQNELRRTLDFFVILQPQMLPLRTFRSNFSRRNAAQAFQARAYASQNPGNPMLEVFNRKTKHLQKDRAAQNVEQSRKVDYLKDEVATRLCERLLVGYYAARDSSPVHSLTRASLGMDRISNATFHTLLTSAQIAATLPKLSQIPISM